MAEVFENGLKHRTIGTHRSVISAFHDPIRNIRLDNHPRISVLMSGLFNKRSPQPKYPFIWNEKTVLNFLMKFPGNACYQINYLRWTSQYCRIIFLHQGYQRLQNINLLTHFPIPIWWRLVRGVKSPTPIWSFIIFQVTVYCESATFAGVEES